jgi:signal peptidase I
MNFALILFLLLLATGALWVVDHLVARKRRPPGTPSPWWVEYGASFFPVILVVFFLRSFLVEPFKIPSGSMIPTLLVGDFILVNKFTYGIRLPVVNTKIVAMNEPQRGDVMVFRYPADPSVDYIKRVVGLPGDRVEYFDKTLKINGEVVPRQPDGDYLHPDRLYYTPRYLEKLGQVEHAILLEPQAPAFVPQALNFPRREDCTYTGSGVACTVPPGHYFMMGDNRDASSDSRVWGFVPEGNIVGKAFFIWFKSDFLLFDFKDFKRLGSFH